MLSRLRQHTSYANVTATLALFQARLSARSAPKGVFALSGGAAYKRRGAARSAPKGYAFA